MHLDEDVVRAGRRLGDVAHLEVLGTGGVDDLDGAHGRRGYRHRGQEPFGRRPNLSDGRPFGRTLSLVIEIEVDVADLAQVRFTTDAVWETTASIHALVFRKHHLLHQRLRRLVPKRPDFDLEPPAHAGRRRRLAARRVGARRRARGRHIRSSSSTRCGVPTSPSPSPTWRSSACWSPTRPPPDGAAGLPRPHRRGDAGLVDRRCSSRCGTGSTRSSARTSPTTRRRSPPAGWPPPCPSCTATSRFEGDRLRVRPRQGALPVRSCGQGLWFMPSVFRWPWVAVDTRETVAPVVSYGARGAGRVWQQPGRGDARGLPDLDRPVPGADPRVPRRTPLHDQPGPLLRPLDQHRERAPVGDGRLRPAGVAPRRAAGALLADRGRRPARRRRERGRALG